MTSSRWVVWAMLALGGCGSDSADSSPAAAGGAGAAGGNGAAGGAVAAGGNGASGGNGAAAGSAGAAQGGTASGGSAAGSAQGGSSSGGSSSGGEAGTAGAATAIPVCQTSCASPADCASPVAFSDEDNWSCTTGACEYLGCKSGECSAGYRCVARDSLSVCERECNSVQDCGQPSAPFDADNYTCESDGACKYAGCNSDAECGALGQYVCRPTGGGLDVCQLSCSAPADCAQTAPGSAYDADNYTCEGGVCVYQGCNSTSECQVVTPQTVCR